MMVRGDFGGMNRDEADFVTPGTSGLGHMGFALNDVFASVFGKDAEAVKQTLQTGASSVATNVSGKYLQKDPNARQGIVDTVRESAAQIYQEYKVPILVVTALSGVVLVSGLYNLYRRNK